MKWTWLRHASWIDTRAKFIAETPRGGSLLDLGSSDGETLRHFAELRPDLALYAVDWIGTPEAYPKGCHFQRANLETDPLPWPNASMDAITCMHVVEHLGSVTNILRETARLLKPGGAAYFETPHPKTVALPSLRHTSTVKFTMNFYDDPTHKQVVTTEALAGQARNCGLIPLKSGISRNWLFVAAYPVLRFLPPSRKKFTAQIHWLGWSAFLIIKKTDHP